MLPNLKFKNEKHNAAIKTIAASVVIVVVAAGAQAAYISRYMNQVYPGVSINGFSLSGLSRDEVIDLLQNKINEHVSKGITVQVDSLSKPLYLDIIATDDPDLSRSLVDADIEITADMAISQGRSNNMFLNLFMPLIPFIEKPSLSIPILISDDELHARILELYPDYREEPAPTSFFIEKNEDTWQIGVIEGETIDILATEIGFAKLTLGLSNLNEEVLNSPIEIPIITTRPSITLEEAVIMIPEAVKVMEASPYTLRYTDNRGGIKSWTLEDMELADMLYPTPLGVELKEELITEFLESIASDINVPFRNAHFEAENDRARTFVPSRNGHEVNIDETGALILSAVMTLSQDPINMVIDVTAPTVSLAEANDLGIKEILGVGVSDFSGSPSNRVKNIKNGARLLNGLLIPPGEVLSLVKSLEPFTTENGYLPELVIKGDQIIPEIGGGLCQIGTTTFRATMNSGLEVTERRNHSLVVSYYNDPQNGNPGTDATIYGPWPDYKLTNNTENYILLETDVNEVTHMLSFTFWGTDDGREGSYTPPVVEQWYGEGETRYIKTTDIPAGTTKCQGAHPGAKTSFTYMVENPDGTTTEEVFNSHYRSLPQICLVGVEQTELDADKLAEDQAQTEENAEDDIRVL
ncbi:MAG: VanW family protein [bacterium]|nr:VanW family protein [bacterium]